MTSKYRGADLFWGSVNADYDLLINRFEQHIDFEGPNGCWEWQSHISRDGYPEMRVKASVILATRFCAFLFLGLNPLQRKTLVCHKCDVRHCVNPDHLFLGDHKANALDAVSKGRSAFGERNAHSVLNEAMVKAIRASYIPRNKEFGARQLAKKYGVSYGAVSSVLRGRTWKKI